MPTPVLADVLHYLGKMGQASGNGDLTDAELLQRFLANREETAFALLVQRHGPMVLGICQRILGNSDSADDSFQATFLVLVRRAASIRKKASLASWLYGVAQRIAVRARATERPKVGAPTAARLDWERRSHERQRKQPLDELTWQELRTVLDEEISRLPEKYRAGLVLCYFGGRSHDQAARELGWPKRSLTSRVSRARELLHRQLLRRGITLSAGALATALGEKVAGAPVAALLTIHTVKAATLLAGGKAAPTEFLSPRVTALAQEAMKGGPGIGGKLVLLVTVLGLAIGGAALASHDFTGKSTARRGEETPAPEARENAAGGEKKEAPVAQNRHEEPLPKGALARLGSTQFRLGNGIYDMALSPDGQTAVAVAGNSQTQFWDVATGKAIRRIDWKQGGGGRVVAYSPDGRWVASVQDYGTLHLWEAATGKHRAKLELQMQLTTSLGFSPDSSVLAVGGGMATYGMAQDTKSNSVIGVWQWDGKNLKSLWEAKPDYEAPLGSRSHHIKALAFSPDGKHLATGGGNNNIIRIWNAADGKEVRQFKSSGTQVGALAFATTGKALASGSDDGVLAFWNPATGTKHWQSKQPGEVRSLAFAPGDKTLVAGGGPEYGWNQGKTNEPFLALLDAQSGKETRRLGIARDSVAAVAFSRDGKVLAAGLGGTLRFWEGTTGKERSFANGHEHWIASVAVSPDGQLAVTAGGDGVLILWDLARGKEQRRLTGHQGDVRAAGFVPGGKLLASASTDQTVRLWELATGKEVLRLKASPKGLLYSIVISPDGQTLAAGDYRDGSVHIWNVATAQLLHRLNIGEQLGHGVLRLAFSPDGKVLAGGETSFNAIGDRNLQSLIFLWDAKTGKELRKFAAHPHAVESLAFSPDGRILASSGWSDKAIKLWDVQLGKKLFELACGSGNGVVTFSPDGKTLAWSSSPKDGICLWEMASKQLRHKFSGHSAAIHGLAFVPDGRTLVSGSMDTTALVWDVTGLRQDAKTPAVLSLDQLPVLWKALASSDAVAAGRAIWSLSGDPNQTVPFLAKRLRDLPATDPKRIHQWIADLDSKTFKVRQIAEKQLEALGKLGEPALYEGLARQPSLEVRQRIEKLLEKRATPILAPEVLQVVRAIEVLEHVGSREAHQALDQFARQSSEDYFKQEARAAALRLGRRIGN